MRPTWKKRKRYSDEAFARELERAANFYEAARLKAVARTGIREDRMMVLLRIVEQDEGVPFDELLKHLDMPKYQLTRISKWLLKRQLATVSVNRNDKRGRSLKASPYGREQAAAVVKAVTTEIMNSLPGRYLHRGRAKRASSTSSCSTKNCLSQLYSTTSRDSTRKVI
jgi:DNA-binding MarR family transcriptional regulator